MYFIKKGYKCNPKYIYIGSEWNAVNYQIPVYKFATELVRKHNLKSVLDIGCGRGVKLLKYIRPVCRDITGIDIQKSDMWLTDDIENPILKLDRKFELIVCSDVIEHLINPDKLFEYIKKFSNPETLIILSTPERDVFRGKNHFGQSPNKCHVREWNKEEFEKYIRHNGLEILESFMARDIPNGKKGCQIYLVRWNNNE